MEYISFPGLGLEAPITVDRVAFTLFGHDVMWYGVIIALSMVLAYFYAVNRAKYEGISSDDMLDFAIFAIISGVVCARLYYVIFAPETYFTGGFLNTLKNIVSVWNGGLAIYGGIIGGGIAIYFVARRKKIKLPVILDTVAPAVMIGQLMGRWGNFLNVEAFGGETTLPWRMGIHKSATVAATDVYVHPTFLYESLWNLVGFILIAVFYKKKKFNGEVFWFYVTWYGLGRMFIEGLRTDALYIGDFRVSQTLAAILFVVGLTVLLMKRFCWFYRGFTDNFTNTRGRASKREFADFAIPDIMVKLALTVTALTAQIDFFGIMTQTELSVSVVTLRVLAFLPLILYFAASATPLISVTTRRLHDIGASGALAVLWLIPVAGWLVMLPVLARAGGGANRYGDTAAEFEVNYGKNDVRTSDGAFLPGHVDTAAKKDKKTDAKPADNAADTSETGKTDTSPTDETDNTGDSEIK